MFDSLFSRTEQQMKKNPTVLANDSTTLQITDKDGTETLRPPPTYGSNAETTNL